MAIHHKRYPEYGLEINIYSGAVTADEMIRSIRGLDPTLNCLGFYDAASDLSGIDVAQIPAIKRAFAAKAAERGGRPKRCALVNFSTPNELFVHFWTEYSCVGVDPSLERAVFPTIEAACDWLGQPPAACEVIAASVAAGLAPPDLEPSAASLSYRRGERPKASATAERQGGA